MMYDEKGKYRNGRNGRKGNQKNTATAKTALLENNNATALTALFLLRYCGIFPRMPCMMLEPLRCLPLSP